MKQEYKIVKIKNEKITDKNGNPIVRKVYSADYIENEATLKQEAMKDFNNDMLLVEQLISEMETNNILNRSEINRINYYMQNVLVSYNNTEQNSEKLAELKRKLRATRYPKHKEILKQKLEIYQKLEIKIRNKFSSINLNNYIFDEEKEMVVKEMLVKFELLKNHISYKIHKLIDKIGEL